MIFGSDAYNRHIGIEPEAREQDPNIDEFLRRLASEIKKVGGAVDITKRISLSSISQNLGDLDLKPFFKGLSAEQRIPIAHLITSVSKELARNPSLMKGAIRDVSDEIDASLAAEMIDLLENSYRRLITLDEMSRPVDPFDGSECFEEAHRCELAGQKIAATVLCRAVLEAALIKATDQSGWIKEQMIPWHSYIGAMLLHARSIRLIDGSRHEFGLEVRDAGNAAIHNLTQFHQIFASKVPAIIDNTRKILEDLFRVKQED